MNYRLLAQKMVINGQEINGPLNPNITSMGTLINRVLSFLLPLLLVILFFVFVLGGYDILMSQGNPEKLKSGKAKITAGIIGVIIITFAFFLTRILAYIFGLDTGLL